MNIHIEQLLRITAERKASDLYLIVGSPPIIRVQGVSGPLDLPDLIAEETQEIADSIMTADQKQQFVTDQQS
jgi:twitching motility protein PilT